MGPLELRLVREFAIQIVQECGRASRSAGAAGQPGLATYRQMFDRAHATWQTTPRDELDGMTPAEFFGFGRRLEATAQAEVRYVELYTDVPSHSDPLPSGAPAAAPDVDERPAWLEARSPGSVGDQPADPNWDRFCERFLKSWLQA